MILTAALLLNVNPAHAAADAAKAEAFVKQVTETALKTSLTPIFLRRKKTPVLKNCLTMHWI